LWAVFLCVFDFIFVFVLFLMLDNTSFNLIDNRASRY